MGREGLGRTWRVLADDSVPERADMESCEAGADTRYTMLTPPACKARSDPAPSPGCPGDTHAGAASRRRVAVALTRTTSHTGGRLFCTAFMNVSSNAGESATPSTCCVTCAATTGPPASDTGAFDGRREGARDGGTMGAGDGGAVAGAAVTGLAVGGGVAVGALLGANVGTWMRAKG